MLPLDTASPLVARTILLWPQNSTELSEDHLEVEKTDLIVFCLLTLHYKANLQREVGVQSHK